MPLARFLGTALFMECASNVLLAQPSLVVPCDPRGTYLRTNQDTPQPPLAIALNEQDLSPGDLVLIERLGDWDCGAPCEDTRLGLLACFSTDAVVGSAGQLHRIPGAIDSGIDVVSPDTYYGDLPTDIPEDFAVSANGGDPSRACLVIPPGAAFLFVSTFDVFFVDNTDLDGDLAIRITRITPCVGDLNLDCAVDLRDLAALLAHYGVSSGASYGEGDLDADGDVDLSDLSRVLANYGSTCP